MDDETAVEGTRATSCNFALPALSSSIIGVSDTTEVGLTGGTVDRLLLEMTVATPPPMRAPAVKNAARTKVEPGIEDYQ